MFYNRIVEEVMGASKLELVYFVLFLLPGLSLIGISLQETELLNSVINALAGFLSLLAALAVMWRWLVFRLELQSRGLAVRQLIWNSREFRPGIISFFLPYQEMCLAFFRPGPGRKPHVYGIVLKNDRGTGLPGEMNELGSRDAPSLYMEAVLDDVRNHRVFTTRLLDEKQMKLLTADLILRAPNLKLEDNLRFLMGLEQGGTKLRKSYSWELIMALTSVAVMAVVLFILQVLNKI